MFFSELFTKMKTIFKRLFSLLLQFSIALSLCLFSIVIILPLVLFFLLLKFLVFLCAKICRRDLLHFMQSPGSCLAQEDIHTKPKMNICVMLIYNGRIDLEKLRSLFEERVIQKLRPNGQLLYPELKMAWTTFLNYTFWKKVENFELKNHVRLYDTCDEENNATNANAVQLPNIKETEEFSDEEDLRRIMGQLLEKPWKRDQSPWELLLIQNFKSNNRKPSDNAKSAKSTVAILRLHHALGDGYSVLKLLLRDMMLADPGIGSSNRSNSQRKIKTWKEIGLSAILPLRVLWDVANCVMNGVDGRNAWHGWGPKHKLSRKTYTSFSDPIDSQIIKNIKNKYGVSYNGVLCAVAAAGCQRIMEEVGQVVPKQVTCFVPYPLPRHPDGLVNHVSFYLFKWVLDQNLTREERLKIISKNMMPSRHFAAPLGFWCFEKFLNCTPNVFLKIRNLVPSTIGLTSFPAQKDEQTFDGIGVQLVDTTAGCGPGTGTTGCAMCFVSSNGKQRFTISIDKNIFPSEEVFKKLGRYIEDELMVLNEMKRITESDDKELFILP